MRILSRDPGRIRAEDGVEAVKGDLMEVATVRGMYAGVDGAFVLNAVSPTEAHEGLMAVSAAIVYSLPVRAPVVLRLFDVQGREVRTLVNEEQLPGRYRVDFGATGLASGVYFYRLEAGREILQRKLVLLK